MKNISHSLSFLFLLFVYLLVTYTSPNIITNKPKIEYHSIFLLIKVHYLTYHIYKFPTQCD